MRERAGDDTAAILAQIDDAIDDWSVSPDAMRCGAPPGMAVGASESGPVAPRINPASFTAMAVSIRVSMEKFAEAMGKAVRDINRMVEANPALRRALGMPSTTYDEHHPRPLCIDGHAYRHRRRHR